MKKLMIGALLAATALTFGGPSFAAYPEKKIEVIVPSTAGGGTDTMARLFAKFAEEKLGQTMVVVNKPGAGGQIGFEAIARAKPDGYTIGCIYTPHFAAHVAAGRAKYTLDDFWVMGNLVTDPGILVVPANSPYQTLQDFITAAGSERLTAGTSGPGGDDDFARLSLEEAFDVTLSPVPAKGSSDAKAAVLGGHVNASFMNVSQVEAQVKAGDLRALAVLTKERVAELPDVPTVLELTGKEVLSDSSRGFAAPAGIPEEAKAKLTEVFEAVVKDPAFIEASKGQLQLNMQLHDEYHDELAKLMDSTKKRFEKSPW